MSDLQLTLALHADKQIVRTIKNLGNTPLTVGSPTLFNLRFRLGEDASASPWHSPMISDHLPHSDGLFLLEPMQSKNVECNYLIEYKFPSPGKYTAWFFYDTLGFKERFAEPNPSFTDLETLDEFRCLSNEIVVEVSESDYEFNKQNVRRLIEPKELQTANPNCFMNWVCKLFRAN